MTIKHARVWSVALGILLARTAFAVQVASDWDAPGTPHPALKVGEILPPRVRTPQFPLKDKRTLYTEEEVRQARENVAHYPAAKVLADEIVKQAAYWVEWDDIALRDLVTTAEVPRAFDCCAEGCPVHGKKIFEVTKSTYPWIIDPKHPFQVKCPIGGETYPSNDYGKFYRSGFKDRSDFNGPYVDDGRGWVSPTGARYWFVAHANHWAWYWHPQADHPSIIKAMEYLGRAYLLTGEKRYAHKAAVLMRRIAEVYPNMDYESQSRYGEILEAKGERYTGKVVNAIWEAQMSTVFAETYEMIWDSIDGDVALQKLYGQDGRAIRSFIEANYLEEVIDAYYQHKTRGNYGMHQLSLLTAAIVRQHGTNTRYLADIVERPEGAMFLGLRYSLYNLIWRDGEPYESPEYNFSWVNNLTLMADRAQRLGQKADSLPRLRRLLEAPLAATVIGKFTPAIGDSGTVYGALIGEATPYQQGYRTYGEARFAQFLAGTDAAGEKGFRSFESLLHPAIPTTNDAPVAGRRVPPQASRLLSGYGLSILNNPADDTAFTLYHGFHLTHVHYDRLNLELFANGQAMLPDLGYPDAMNELISGIFTWSLNTISHNTVTVDASRQPGNVAGVVELQAGGDWARTVIVNAPGTYPQCDLYRRSLVMIDADATHHYAVDFFEVSGGHQHDYTLHGPPGNFRIEGGKWTEPAPGTLAGENVPLGQIYDDSALGAKHYKGGYMSYHGSGFQHLTQVRREVGENSWSANYTHEKDAKAQVGIRVLPQTEQETILAEARVSPVKWPQTLHFIIARRQSKDAALMSKFVSVIEPHTGESFIKSARRIEIAGGTAVIIERLDGRTEVVLHGASSDLKTLEVNGCALQVSARVAVFTLDEKNAVERIWFADGESAKVNGVVHTAQKSWRGNVVSIEPAAETVRVKLDGPRTASEVAGLAGQVVNFYTPLRTVNSVKSAQIEGEELVLRMQDDMLIGLVQPKEIQADRFVTKSSMLFAKLYTGAGLRSSEGKMLGRVREAGDNWIAPLESATLSALSTSKDLWVTQFSPGDGFEAPATYAWRR